MRQGNLTNNLEPRGQNQISRQQHLNLQFLTSTRDTTISLSKRPAKNIK
jgi:hypothetical protein